MSLDPRETITALSNEELALLGVLVVANSPMEFSHWLDLVDTQAGVNRPTMPSRIVASRLIEAGLVQECGDLWFVETPTALEVLEQLHARDRLTSISQSPSGSSGFSWSAIRALGTDLRVALIQHDWQALERVLARASRWINKQEYGPWLLESLGPTISPERLSVLPKPLQQRYLGQLFEAAPAKLFAIDEAFVELGLAESSKKLRLDLGRVLILRGDVERATSITGLGKAGNQSLALLAAFWAGDYAEAARLGNELVAAMVSRKHKTLAKLEGLCHALACLVISGDDPGQLQTVQALLDAGAAGSAPAFPELALLNAIHLALVGDRRRLKPCFSAWPRVPVGWLSLLVRGLHDLWLDLHPIKASRERGGPDAEFAIRQLRGWAELAQARNYAPVAQELAALLGALSAKLGKPGKPAKPAKRAKQAERPSLVSTFHAPSAWEAAIAGLEAIAEESSPALLAAEQGRQLVWELTLDRGAPTLAPRIRQSARARKGTLVPLSRLVAGDEDCLSDHDRRVLAGVETEEPSIYGRSRQRILTLGDRSLAALIGHPHVIDPLGQPLEVQRRQPKLRTRREQGKVQVELIPKELNERALLCSLEAPGRVVIYERSPALARVAEVLRGQLEVPEQGVEQLSRTLARLSVSAAVEIEGDLTPEAERVEADPRPVLLLEWDGGVLRVHARVAPLGLVAVHLRPGVGNPLASAQVPGADGLRMLRCQRDLGEEQRRLAAFERACPTLVSYAEAPGYWCPAGLTDALEVMVELGSLGDAVVLAWPEGRALQPPIPRELSHLHTTVSSGVNWLDIEAELELDEGAVMSFRELLDARVGPRFVALGQDRFLALSERLRRQLDALQNLGTRKAGGLRVTPAMLPVLDGFEGVSFDADTLARLEGLRTINETRPRLPRGFLAELRDYQREGYTWLWRLAEAGLGACLADDMGLGKTIQALALLSQRAGKGPALVVCPTSVAVNWINETARFAPNLRTTILASASDRAAALAGAGRRDLIVCTYGLLVTETEALAAVEFATVVFDEAHALKNEATKRAQAARELQAGFRLGLTGTPVENRVEELWGLFRVLVPGLLGSKAHFDDRFAKPIARGERGRATELRALLEHFILRRTKTQVLTELPPRTDITVQVPPSPEARAYYEALRRRAVDEIAGGDPKKKRFRILAEISRLRQAAVDPRLLNDPAAPAGAKIDALVELVLALRDEGHRALVFTQFLGSMALLRARLAAAGVEYLELDGSTSADERARRVDAFQGGEADVFVLSLRAGGVGINLTAADYVLHLDPWWNPAVEDQATDRAHRMGQTRPVTVYRLVSEGTIEEKILALHGSKRELADDLLAGMERAGGLNVDELMGLLRD